MVTLTFDLAPSKKLDYTFDFSADLDAISAEIEGSPVITVSPASPALTVVSSSVLAGNKKVSVVLTHSSTDYDVEWAVECKINATTTPDRDFKQGMVIRNKPVTPAAENGLTTVARVVAELGITDAAKQSLVADWIMEASEAIQRYCNRVFAKEVGLVEQVYPYGSNLLMVSRTPLLSIASITLDGVTVDPSLYSIDSPLSGFIYAPAGWSVNSRYTVTYTAGYVLPGNADRTLPRDIERACIMLVRNTVYGRKDTSIKSESVPDVYSVTYSDSAADASTMPNDAVALLSQYKRRRL